MAILRRYVWSSEVSPISYLSPPTKHATPVTLQRHTATHTVYTAPHMCQSHIPFHSDCACIMLADQHDVNVVIGKNSAALQRFCMTFMSQFLRCWVNIQQHFECLHDRLRWRFSETWRAQRFLTTAYRNDRFLRATAYAVSAHMLSQFRLSVRPSVRLSHGWISQKRLKLG